jgi:hypothetical protein
MRVILLITRGDVENNKKICREKRKERKERKEHVT